MVEVSVEARNDPDNPGYVKLQSSTWELNVWATTDDLWKLADIEATDWSQRRVLAVGTGAGAPVWWSEEDGTVSILVGKDYETWDVGIVVPLETVRSLLAALGETSGRACATLGTHAFLSALCLLPRRSIAVKGLGFA